MIDQDAELRSHIARLGEGEDEPAFHCSNCGLTSDKSDCWRPRLANELRCPDCGEVVEHWTPDRWVPFWFESDSVCGMVFCRSEWVAIQEIWLIGSGENCPRNIYDSKEASSKSRKFAPTHSFGDREVYTGPQTLRDFFLKNGMRL